MGRFLEFDGDGGEAVLIDAEEVESVVRVNGTAVIGMRSGARHSVLSEQIRPLLSTMPPIPPVDRKSKPLKRKPRQAAKAKRRG